MEEKTPDQSHGQPHVQEKQEQPAVPDEFFPVRLQKIPEGKDLEQVKGLEDQHKDQRAQNGFKKRAHLSATSFRNFSRCFSASPN